MTKKIDNAIIAIVTDAATADAQRRSATDLTGGVYSALLNLYNSVGNETFMASLAIAEKSVRENLNGVAVKMGAKQGKSGAYQIPGSIRNAKSVLTGAYEFKIPTDCAFTELRKLVEAERKARKLAEAGDDGRALEALRAALAAALESLPTMDSDKVPAAKVSDAARAMVEDAAALMTA